MINIPLYNFPDRTLYFALNKTYKEIADFLFSQDIPVLEVVDYMTDKTPGVKGKTTLFSNGLVFVRMYHFDRTIRRVSILAHEILHASIRIIGDCKKEENVAYLLDYIFEEIMKELKLCIDYADEGRDVEWLIESTSGNVK